METRKVNQPAKRIVIGDLAKMAEENLMRGITSDELSTTPKISQIDMETYGRNRNDDGVRYSLKNK